MANLFATNFTATTTIHSFTPSSQLAKFQFIATTTNNNKEQNQIQWKETITKAKL